MNKLFVLSVLLATCLTNTFPINTQNIGDQCYSQSSKKVDKEKIDLESRLERRSDVYLPEILLLKRGELLEATLINSDCDIRVQIIGKGNLVLFESTINRHQQKWQLNINFLQQEERYRIKFVPSTGDGFLFGYFQQ